MNPILLKPTTDTGSQIIVHGRPVGNMSVAEYDRFKPEAFTSITESYARLKKQYDFIVIEGAGSIAEINLKDRDIANLSVARMADNCPAILVADIDRGGVFAQVVGSIMLLEPWERALVKGVIINKFRGDATILEPGLKYIEQRCNIPVLGVVPWLSNINLPAEDSLALPPATDRVQPSSDRICIGIVKLPRISNFTDFDPLLNEPDVDLCYLDRPCALDGLDLLIIPGSKATAQDLQWLRESGLEQSIKQFKGQILGICGGYQMLGQQLRDPDRIESSTPVTEGIGLLPVTTLLKPAKATRIVSATPSSGAATAIPAWQERICGYEIHMGLTSITGDAAPFMELMPIQDSAVGTVMADGAVSPDGRIIGSYLHGLFDDQALRAALLGKLRHLKGLPQPATAQDLTNPYDRLADHLSEHLDLPRIWSICGLH
jgi:adenosylcobyric acid synthase